MSEIQKEIKKDEIGNTVISENHTIADIARWIIANNWDEEITYFLENRETDL